MLSAKQTFTSYKRGFKKVATKTCLETNCKLFLEFAKRKFLKQCLELN